MNTQERKMKTIKRYQNRKLYDTVQSCYVTLDEISDMIVKGEELEVIDNRTKKDITSNTLIQILFEKHKKAREPISIDSLRNVIQAGGGSIGVLFGNLSNTTQNAVERAKETAEKSFENLLGPKGFEVPYASSDDLEKRFEDRLKKTTNTEEKKQVLSDLRSLNSRLNNLETRLTSELN